MSTMTITANETREDEQRLEKTAPLRCDHCGLPTNEGETCSDCAKADARDIAAAEFNQSEYGLPIPAEIRKLADEQEERILSTFEQGCDQAVEEFLVKVGA